MSFSQKIEAIWQNVGIVQKILLIAILIAAVGGGTVLVKWAGRPDMGLLYSSLGEEEAAKIVEKIADKGVAYKLSNGGTSIYVPRETISGLRLEMAKEGLPEGGQKGYGIFDDEKIGTSPFVQNVNLQRALQDELARSIQMIEGIVHSRIHIVSPKHTLFTSNAQETSASIVLKLRAGYRLSTTNIAAITHLVAGSVEGLKSENVTIVDSQGRLLSSNSDDSVASSGAGTVADYRDRVEQGLAEKAEKMLTAVLGPGRATVQVSAEIDMTSVNLVSKSYEGKGVTIDEEIKEKSKADGGSGEGKSGGKETDNTITTKKLFDEKVETVTELPGEIKSLTVAAFVDLSRPELPKSADDEESETANTEAENAGEPIMAIVEVEDIIKNALGLKETDTLKIVNVKFNRPLELLPEEASAGGLDFVAIAGQASLGIMAICALIVLKMFSGAKKKAMGDASGQLALAEGGNAGLLPSGGSANETLVLRKQIANSLQNNPEQAKQLFSSWLEEKS